MNPITTDTVPVGERRDFWADLIARQVNPMWIEPAGDHPLRGRVQPRAVGGLPVAVVSGQGIHAVHGRAEVSRTDRHFHVAGIHLGGEARVIHRGVEVCLHCKDARGGASSERRSTRPADE